MNRKVKICALSTISKTMDWFIVDNMRNLSKNGYDVTLICNMDDGFAERNSDYAQCIDLKMSRGISVSDLFRIPLKLRHIFKENKFDIIYYMTPNAAFYASIGGILAGIHTRVYCQAGLRYVSASGGKRVIFKMIEKMTCAFSITIRAVSLMNRQLAIDEGLCSGDKISVVGIGGTVGVELSACDSFDHQKKRKALREKYGIAKDAFVYGYVGRINRDKGISELIEAFEKVQINRENAWLVLVGMVDDTNAVPTEMMDRARRNHNIVFTGNVPPEDVYKHMAMFDVLTHPTYREGFGKVLQEAMGMSLPIISTNVPGPSEVVENGISGILVEAKNPEALAEAMIEVYSNEALRVSLANAGRKRAEKYFDRPIMLNNLLLDMNSIASSIKGE
ncbi:MAG: glycosyltransferase family 4 protein [Lachnospiraceae bacterium]|nr:glycosyltransferase family 4 protein [Lachnospiraceae bacterium]